MPLSLQPSFSFSFFTCFFLCTMGVFPSKKSTCLCWCFYQLRSRRWGGMGAETLQMFFQMPAESSDNERARHVVFVLTAPQCQLNAKCCIHICMYVAPQTAGENSCKLNGCNIPHQPGHIFSSSPLLFLFYCF